MNALMLFGDDGLREMQRIDALEKKVANLAPLDGRFRTWLPTVYESFTGAWQQNVTVTADTALAYFAVYACVTLIASDIAKMCLRLVEEDDNGIWEEASNPAYSPVLRRPNRYQTRGQFIQWWVTSLLCNGNTYILKERDNRNVVVALYVLDPTRVTVLVAPDGSVYYQLQKDQLSGLNGDPLLTVPASEIIHDRLNPLFHPLVGVSPIYACGLSSLQGLRIQSNQSNFFANGSNPGGFLTAPGHIAQDTADRLKAYFDSNFTGDNAGKVAVAGDGLTFQPLRMSAVDAQLIEQLKFTAVVVCACFHVPPYMIGIGDPPNYNNIEALSQQYYQQALQNPIESIESCLDYGLGLGAEFGNSYGTEFDLDDLLRMDTATMITSERDAIGAGIKTPNESRRRLGLKPVQGGNTPYLQQQNYSLAALDRRDNAEPAPDTPGANASPATPQDAQSEEPVDMAAFMSAIHRKALAEGLYAAG